jgi:hypothetical protein
MKNLYENFFAKNSASDIINNGFKTLPKGGLNASKESKEGR